MKKNILTSALVLAAGMGSMPALAQDWYIGIKGGVTFPRDARYNQLNGTQDIFRTDEKRGYIVAGQLGYDAGLIRVETDVAYQQTKLRGLTNNSYAPLVNFGTGDAAGKRQSWNLMLNVLFDVINTDRFTISVGGGAGAVRSKIKNYQTAGQPVFLNDRDWSFGYQGLAGMRFALSETTDLTFDYRYMQTQKAKFVDGFGTGFQTKFKSHAALAGIAFKFGGEKVQQAPAEPMAAAPAPEPTYTPAPAPTPVPEPVTQAQPGPFIIFFDWNQSSLTSEAQSILRNAVATFRNNGQAMIAVAGYADKSGADAYNDQLSMRRAEAVKSFLLQEGVQAQTISTEAFGERNPLVETADGVREPQNRRVEIKLSNKQ